MDDFIEKYQKATVQEVSNSVPKEPMVSVCVQTYQHANYIEQCLGGILQQKTHFQYEILLGEDASTDGTREKCIEYAQKFPDKIKLYLHSRENNISFNGTPTGKFNFIFNLYSAKGKYIALCEGDDYWTDPYKLQKQVDFLDNNPDFIGCAHNSKIIYEWDHNKIHYRWPDYVDYPNEVLTLEDHIGEYVPFHTSSYVFRNMKIDLPNFFFRCYSGDICLFTILAQMGKVKIIDEVMSVRRKHEHGITTVLNKADGLRNRIELYKELNYYFNFKYNHLYSKLIEEYADRLIKMTSSENLIKTSKNSIKLESTCFNEHCDKKDYFFGMTSQQEQAYFEHYSSETYTGTGEIVDLGVWMGATTSSLARGLEKRTDINRNKRIHAFDRFVWKASWGKYLSDCMYNYKDGESFLQEFKERTMQWSSLIEIHAGDLTTMRWHGGPIEFLLIDAMKSWDTANAVQQIFYPFLLPNKSYIVHQDFKHYYSSWIHLLTYRFRDHFEKIHNVPKSSSVIFRYKEPIEAQLLQRIYSFDDFPKEEIDEAFHYSMSLVPLEERPNIAAAKVMLYLHLKDYDSALRELNNFISQGFPTISNDLEKVMQKLNESGNKQDIVTKFYQGGNAETYEASRKNNPKWQFEDEALDFVLKQYRAEISSIIDAPVGTGRFLDKYERLGDDVRVYGVDYSSDMLDIASGKSKAIRMELVKHDLINRTLNVSADLTVCYRFLNLIEWPSVVAVLKNLLTATRKYILFAVRTINDNYKGETYIENKIYLHFWRDIEKLIGEHNFAVIKRFEFNDERAGQYSIVLCERARRVQDCRVNKNFRVVYTYGAAEPVGKIYQVKDISHAQFIRQITNYSDIRGYFPQIKRIDDNFVDAEWIAGEIIFADRWEDVIEVLVKIQSLSDLRESSFDYIEDLVIPRFYNIHPIAGADFCADIISIINEGKNKYERKISHPDIIPGNVIMTSSGFVIIDNELLCCTQHHRIDLLNTLYNCDQKYREKVLSKYLKLSDISHNTLQNEQYYLSALWLARQVGSCIVKNNNVQAALSMIDAYKRSENILPVDLSVVGT